MTDQSLYRRLGARLPALSNDNVARPCTPSAINERLARRRVASPGRGSAFRKALMNRVRNQCRQSRDPVRFGVGSPIGGSRPGAPVGGQGGGARKGGPRTVEARPPPQNRFPARECAYNAGEGGDL